MSDYGVLEVRRALNAEAIPPASDWEVTIVKWARFLLAKNEAEVSGTCLI